MDAKINDVELSCQGIDMMVNNDLNGCEELFKKYKDSSPLMNYCYSFISLMRAIMSFEEAALEKASAELEMTIKLCSSSNKMLSSLKKAFGLTKSTSSSFSTLKEQFARTNTLEDKFTKQIIIADCKLFRAILTFLNQDYGSYLNKGVLQIRSSWKMYARIQKQLFDMYKKLEPKAEQIYGINEELLLKANSIFTEVDNEDDANNNKKSSKSEASNKVEDDEDEEEEEENVQNAMNEINLNSDELLNNISLDSVKRLLGAVSFGYGMFQICISFLPPNILKLIKIFGFEGDRTSALKAISFTSRSKDMRAPFADMMLLWYQTVAKQLFHLSEADVSVGSNEEVEQILNRCLQKYPRSSLFLFYKGRYYRSLRDLKKAHECFQQAIDYATQTRELQLIAVYETGWLHLMNLNYEVALGYFKRLSEESKWSRSFHKYVCALLHGAIGNFKDANQAIKDGLSAVKMKSNPIEMLAMKRLEYFKKNQIKTNAICEFMCIELNFLWVCIPYCEKNALETMLQNCDKQIDKNLYPIKCLFEGAIHVQLENIDFGRQCFEEAIARYENDKQVPFLKYVQPFASHQLALIEMNEKNFDTSKQLLNKVKDNYKDYDFENRLLPQVRSALKRLKYLIDKENNSKNQSTQQQQQQKSEASNDQAYKLNNFYV